MKATSLFTLDEWLDFLENRLAQEIQLGLSRVATVIHAMQILPFKAQVITVAGTNGKGSTVATLESIYLSAGYNVATYTSPHVRQFNERIRIQGVNATNEQLCQAFSIIEDRRGAIPLTYFETVTLAALWLFKQVNLEVIILEVGLGGRLDATNIVDADLAIITSVGFDHQQFLGHSLDEIGYEKSGIMRADKPFIYGDFCPPQTVISQANVLNVNSYCLGKQYSYQLTADHFILSFQDHILELKKPQLHPNACAAALMATYCLEKVLPVTEEQRTKGAQHVVLLGRFQTLQREVPILLDVAHNVQAVENLAAYVQALEITGAVHVVFAALKDKEIAGMVESFKNAADYWYPATLKSKRAASLEQMKAAFYPFYDIIPPIYDSPEQAYAEASRQAQANDLVVVFGSFITVSNVLALLNEV